MNREHAMPPNRNMNNRFHSSPKYIWSCHVLWNLRSIMRGFFLCLFSCLKSSLRHPYQEVYRVPPMCNQLIIAVDGVTNTMLFVPEIWQNGIEAAVVAITGRCKTLTCPGVPPVTERGDESHHLTVTIYDGDTMFLAPSIPLRIRLARWNVTPACGVYIHWSPIGTCSHKPLHCKTVYCLRLGGGGDFPADAG